MSDKKRAISSQEKQILRRLLAYLKPQRGALIGSILGAVGIVALTLYLPILQGRAIDRIAGQGQVDFAGILRILLIFGACALTAGVLQWIQNLLNNRLTFRIIERLRNDAFDHIHKLPLSYLDAHPSGETLSRVIADADQVADGLLLGFTQLFTGVLTILGTLLFMLRISWILTLLVVLLTPISLFAARFIARKTYRHFRRQSEIRGEQTALIQEMIDGRKVVGAYGQQEAVQARFDEVNGRLKDSSLKAVFFSSLTNPCTRFVNSLVYAAAGVAGAALAIRGGISVGDLSAVLSYANQYTKPFNEISGVVTELQNAIACAGRLLDLIDEKVEQDSDTNSCPSVKGEVAIDHIYFSYVPERPLIRDFTLQVAPGSKVAIVGPTGCGKTTLINLLMRFYDVQQGDIRLDGRSIYGMHRGALRAGYGMVLQDTWIKEASVRDNIAMGRPDATDEEIRTAARRAHADGFIRRLPQGYDTLLKDNSALSEGQRQLLCIARVMLALPPMLILDEATSSIDTRTELQIQAAFDALSEGRTSFIVAHRLSTIRSADIILVMRDGSIVEQGTHDELLARGGFYATLYQSQFAPS